MLPRSWKVNTFWAKSDPRNTFREHLGIQNSWELPMLMNVVSNCLRGLKLLRAISWMWQFSFLRLFLISVEIYCTGFTGSPHTVTYFHQKWKKHHQYIDINNILVTSRLQKTLPIWSDFLEAFELWTSVELFLKHLCRFLGSTTQSQWQMNV